MSSPSKALQIPWTRHAEIATDAEKARSQLDIYLAGQRFHGEIPQFAHRASYVALVGGGLLAIPTIVGFLGIGGALI